MSFDLPAILTLGELDRRLIAARKRLAAAPQQAAPQEQRVASSKGDIQRLTDEAKHTERDVKRLEGEAEAKKQAITKNEVALNMAKSNDEYQALLRAMDGQKQELSDIETRILEAYEAQERLVEERAAAQQRLKAVEADLQAARQRVAALEAEVRAEVSELDEQRGRAAQAVSPEILELYRRVLEKVGDAAVVRVIDEMCQGCYTKIRPNQVSQIRGRKELVTCWDCGRLLYADTEA